MDEVKVGEKCKMCKNGKYRVHHTPIKTTNLICNICRHHVYDIIKKRKTKKTGRQKYMARLTSR